MITRPYKNMLGFLMMLKTLPIDIQPTVRYESKGAKGGKTPHKTGHKHMAYVRKMHKLKARRMQK